MPRRVKLYSRASGRETGETTIEELAASVDAQNVLSPRLCIGLDLSLRRPGFCSFSPTWDPINPWESVDVLACDEEEDAGSRRLLRIVRATEDFVEEHWSRTTLSVPPAIAVEQHAFGQGRGAYALERAELVGAIKAMARVRWGVEVVPIVASSARKLLFGPTKRTETGGKNGWKKYILARFREMGSEMDGEDERDAFVICNALRYGIGMSCLAHG